MKKGDKLVMIHPPDNSHDIKEGDVTTLAYAVHKGGVVSVCLKNGYTHTYFSWRLKPLSDLSRVERFLLGVSEHAS